MKLFNFNDEIVFDTFPKTPRRFQKVFVTTCKWLASAKFDDAIQELPTIYTSKILATQILKYFQQIELKTIAVMVRLKPFEPCKIPLASGKQIEVMLFEGNDNVSHNCMLAIRLHIYDPVAGYHRKKQHFYGGLCTDIRCLMLNEQAVDWLADGVDHLYMHFRRSPQNADEREQAAGKILKFLRVNSIESKVIVIMPLFGYEDLIALMARDLRKRVCLSETMHQYYVNLSTMEDFQQNIAEAKVIISDSNDIVRIVKVMDPTAITVYIRENDETIPEPTTECYTFLYSPLPMPFELFQLASLLQSDSMRIHNISNRRAHWLPEYLLQFATATTEGAPGQSKTLSTDDVVTSPENAATTNGSTSLTPTRGASAKRVSVRAASTKSDATKRAPTAAPVVAPRKRNICYLDDDDDSD